MDKADPRRQEFSLEFKNLLRSIAHKFPEVPVTVDQLDEEAFDQRPLPLTRYVLNRYNIGLNAIRFTPPGDDNETYDFWWMFLCAQEGDSTWYIISVEDEIDGFTHYNFKRNVDPEIKDAPRKNFLFRQSLRGGQLKAGQEYLIWFVYDPNKDFDVYLNIDLKKVMPQD